MARRTLVTCQRVSQKHLENHWHGWATCSVWTIVKCFTTLEPYESRDLHPAPYLASNWASPEGGGCRPQRLSGASACEPKPSAESSSRAKETQEREFHHAQWHRSRRSQALSNPKCHLALPLAPPIPWTTLLTWSHDHTRSCCPHPPNLPPRGYWGWVNPVNPGPNVNSE